MTVRNEVTWFSVEMERKLKSNDHKRHWRYCEFGYLTRRTGQELDELRSAIKRFKKDPSGENRLEVIKEAADVANFAMMIADNANKNLLPNGHLEGLSLSNFRRSK